MLLSVFRHYFVSCAYRDATDTSYIYIYLYLYLCSTLIIHHFSKDPSWHLKRSTAPEMYKCTTMRNNAVMMIMLSVSSEHAEESIFHKGCIFLFYFILLVWGNMFCNWGSSSVPKVCVSIFVWSCRKKTDPSWQCHWKFLCFYFYM